MENEDILNFTELNNEMEDLISQSELESNLLLQTEEIEILRAVYYKDKEFLIDEVILTKMNQFLMGNSSEMLPQVEFMVNIEVDNLFLEIQVILLKMYPTVEPKIFVRSNQLSRNQQINFNKDLELFISSLERRRMCVYEIISWITDNVCKYNVLKNETNVNHKVIEEAIFARLWIYSHHIFSNEKRKDIVAFARKCNITGFCMPGKPGIICIEGLNTDCDEWWHKIKSMTWKKFMCIKKEEIKLIDMSCESMRKFKDFVELNFREKDNLRESRTVMGEFYRYLLEHDCGPIFKNFFGFEGKISSS